MTVVVADYVAFAVDLIYNFVDADAPDEDAIALNLLFHPGINSTHIFFD
jgi:hypothetical protein